MTDATPTYLPEGTRVIDAADGDRAVVTDLGGFATWANALPETPHMRGLDRKWAGGMTYSDAARAIAHGDMAGVEASDRLLSAFEADMHPTPTWRTFGTVAGGAPNVGAYLAGSPVAMRQRRRVVDAAAPLTVFVDTVSSGGIEAEDLRKRGVAVLALVRALSNVRPVTVYAVAAMQHHGCANSWIAVSLDQPLDLARAAFALAHPAFARALMYEAGPRLHGKEANGSLHWAFADVNKYRAVARDRWAALVQAAPEDCLYLAPPHMDDAAIRDGAQWVRDTLAKHGGAAPE
jgi:hypothetical protein